MLEYGFRQAIRDEVLATVTAQKPLFDALAAAVERRMSPIIEDEVREHFLVRLRALEPGEREQIAEFVAQVRSLLTSSKWFCSKEHEEKGKEILQLLDACLVIAAKRLASHDQGIS